MDVQEVISWSSGPAAAVVERYHADVRNYFLRRLHRSPHDVDDLAQEVCVRFLSMGEGKSPDRPLHYLYGIARHVLADFLTRRERERRHIVANLDSVDDWLAPDRSAALNDPADSVAIQQQVAIALLSLPASHKNVLFAHEHDGYSYNEVAVRLGFTKQTVEKYLTQAKAKLRATSCAR